MNRTRLITVVTIAALLIAGAFIMNEKTARVDYSYSSGLAGGEIATTTATTADIVPAPPRNLAPTLVTASDLAAAGFISPKPQPPESDGMYRPAAYFWIGAGAKPTVTGNLVMVSVVTVPAGASALYKYGTSTAQFTIAGGIGQTGKLPDGRTAVNFVKHGNYAVVIGPTEKETEALAAIIAAKLNNQ